MCFIRQKKDKEIQNKQAKEERELRGYYIYIKVKPAANHVAVFNTKVQKINRSSEKHHVSVYCACIHTQRLQSWFYGVEYKKGRLALFTTLQRTKED